MRYYAALVAASAIWGVSFATTKYALSVMGPLTLVFTRFALSAVVLLALSPILKVGRIERRDLKYFFILCAFEPGLYYILETFGIVRTDPTSAALIIASIPVLVIILARITVGEKLSAAKIAGAAISIAGVFLVTSGGIEAPEAGTAFIGNALVFGAAITAACFTVLLSRLAKMYSAVTVTRFQVYFAAAFFMPFGLVEVSSRGVGTFGPVHFVALAYLAIMSGIVAFLLYNYGLSRLEAGTASVFINLIPVFTAVFTWAFMGLELTMFHLAGGVLTLGGVMIASIRSKSLPVTEQF